MRQRERQRDICRQREDKRQRRKGQREKGKRESQKERKTEKGGER